MQKKEGLVFQIILFSYNTLNLKKTKDFFTSYTEFSECKYYMCFQNAL